MDSGKPAGSTLSEQLANDPGTLRKQLLDDPVQRQVWGVGPDNLEAEFTARSELFRQLQLELSRFCRQENIPVSLDWELWHIYLPFAQWIVRRADRVARDRQGAFVLGVNGAQGSGKTTINQILQLILRLGFERKVVGFSIDDLYDSYTRRKEKAREISPIFSRVRGPGTHDLELGIAILDDLINARPTRIPRFDKSLADNQGDRMPESEWLAVGEAQDIVIFEGWNLGEAPFPEQPDDARFAKLQNSEGFRAWRDYYVAALADSQQGYAALFDRLDDLVMIRIQDFNEVYKNRETAEAKLRQRIAANQGDSGAADGVSAMTPEEVRSFVDHYEPWTQHMLAEMPERAALVFWMGADHKISRITANPSPSWETPERSGQNPVSSLR